jgi:hypothetical protein
MYLDRFMREERLRDELETARRQRMELEAALLDRLVIVMFMSYIPLFSSSPLSPVHYEPAQRLASDREPFRPRRKSRCVYLFAMIYRSSYHSSYYCQSPMSAAEVDRLRRRVKELESLNRALSTAAAAAAGAATAGGGHIGMRPSLAAGLKTAWGDETAAPTSNSNSSSIARSKKEKELEGVVEAMKKVIDKLKAENDRLKKGGGPEERKASDAEKRAIAERKRAEKLDEELQALQVRYFP